MSGPSVSIHRLGELTARQRADLLERAESELGDFSEKVVPIIEEVRLRGDAALAEFAQAFDRADLTADRIRATPAEFAAARDLVGEEVIETLTFAAGNVRRFHEKQRPDDLVLHETHPGVMVGDRWTSIDSVACYVPRGKGSFPSTVLMTAIPARVAGVEKLIIITPPGQDGSVDPATLVAAELAGITDVFKCGGAQGVAAVAYGTQSVPKCDKIVGPGSRWVVAAKKHLSSVIDPGSPAGPSELIVFSDASVSPELVALDLCVESEHGPDTSVFLVTTDADFAAKVAAALPAVWSTLPELRSDYSRAVLQGPKGGLVVAADLDEAFGFINDYAPEHLAILSDKPWDYLPRVRHAGEVLLGAHSAIAIANFVLGPSHVLPTGGAARTASPLSVFDFIKRTTIASVSADAYGHFASFAETLGRYEGFEGHANSVSHRRIEAMKRPCSGPAIGGPPVTIRSV